MKKIIILFIMFFLLGLVSCKEKEEEKPIEDEDKVVTPDAITASHVYDVDSDELNPYIVVKGLPSDNGNIDFSLIIFLNFPKNYQDKVLTARYYNYLQCDYYTDNESTIYYHNFDHSDDDGGHLSNAIKFVPRYNTSDVISKVVTSIKYEFDLDGEKQDKEMKFEENILCFNEDDFKDAINDEAKASLVITKRDDEDYKRYKLNISLDENSGHYDIQTWLEIDGKIIPFIGYYHYLAKNGNINSVSDEKINIDRTVSSVYYMIRFYDSNGNVTDTYYQKRLD